MIGKTLSRSLKGRPKQTQEKIIQKILRGKEGPKLKDTPETIVFTKKKEHEPPLQNMSAYTM
jgi:hypothetical protein